MALLGHSGSQAPQFIHSSVILIAIIVYLTGCDLVFTGQK